MAISILQRIRNAVGTVGGALSRMRERSRQSSAQAQQRRREFLTKQQDPAVRQAQSEQIQKFATGQYGLLGNDNIEKVNRITKADMQTPIAAKQIAAEKGRTRSTLGDFLEGRKRQRAADPALQQASEDVLYAVGGTVGDIGPFKMNEAAARKILNHAGDLTEEAINTAWKKLSKKTFPRTIEEQASKMKVSGQQLVNEARDYLKKLVKPAEGVAPKSIGSTPSVRSGGNPSDILGSRAYRRSRDRFMESYMRTMAHGGFRKVSDLPISDPIAAERAALRVSLAKKGVPAEKWTDATLEELKALDSSPSSQLDSPVHTTAPKGQEALYTQARGKSLDEFVNNKIHTVADRKPLRVDESGKNIVSDFKGYEIAVNDPKNPSYLTVWKDGKKVGFMATADKASGIPSQYVQIGNVAIDKAHQGQGLATELYKTLAKYLPEGKTGIAGYGTDIVATKKIPSIYKKLGAVEKEGNLLADIPTKSQLTSIWEEANKEAVISKSVPVQQKLPAPPEPDPEAFDALVRDASKEEYRNLIDQKIQQLEAAMIKREASGVGGSDYSNIYKSFKKGIAGYRLKYGDIPDDIEKLFNMRGRTTGNRLAREIEAAAENLGMYVDDLFQELRSRYTLEQSSKAGPTVSTITRELASLEKSLDKLEGIDRSRAAKRIRLAMAEAEKATGQLSPGQVKPVIREVIKPKAPKVTMREDALLRKRLRDEARGAAIGAQEARMLTQEELLAKFRSSLATVRNIQDDLLRVVRTQLPPQEMARFAQMINRVGASKLQMYKALMRISDRVLELQRSSLIGDIKDLANIPKGIAVDYKKKIEAIVSEIDFAKPSDATLKKLRSLADFIKKDGVPLGINPKRIAALDRLTKKPAASLSLNELKELHDTLNILHAQGKLKAKLINLYEQRIYKRNLAKLVSDTKSFDPPTIGKKGMTQLQQGRVDATRAYFNTLHTFRVADALDGGRGYKGENAKLIKKQGDAATLAQFQARNATIAALEDIAKLGFKTLTDDQQLRIMINIRNREGANDAVETLLKKGNYETIPDLTDQEKELVDMLQKYTNINKDMVAATYEELTGEIFPELETYILPLKYENEFNVLPQELIKPTRGRRTNVEQGFTKERQKGVEKMPRVDVLGLLEEALNDQLWYIHMQPLLTDTAQLVKSPDYQKKAGQLASIWWQEQLDTVARRGWSATAQASPTLRNLRGNLTKAILGYKLSTIAMQPFAVIDALAYATSKYGARAAADVIAEATKAWINPRLAEATIKNSPALSMRLAGELVVEEAMDAAKSNPYGKFTAGAMKLIQIADIKTAAGVQNAFAKILRRAGVDNVQEESEFLMNLVSGSSDVPYRPHVLASGDLSRTWFTFKTFALNRWGITAHDLISTGVVHGNWKAKLGALAGLIIYGLGAIAEQQAKDAINDTITHRPPKQRSTIMTALMSFPEQIPFFGEFISALEYSGGVNAPLMQVIENTFTGAKSLITGKKPETKLRGGLRLAESIATLLGMPGAAQLADIAEGQLLPKSADSAATNSKPEAGAEVTGFLQDFRNRTSQENLNYKEQLKTYISSGQKDEAAKLLQQIQSQRGRQSASALLRSAKEELAKASLTPDEQKIFDMSRAQMEEYGRLHPELQATIRKVYNIRKSLSR